MEVSSRIRGAALLALGILAALAVVAIASQGSRPSTEARSRNAVDVLIDILFAFYLLSLVLGAILFVYLLYLRRKLRVEGRPQTSGLLQSAFGLLVFLALGFVFSRRVADPRPMPPPEETDPIFPVATAGPTTVGIEHAAETPFAWIPVIATIGLLVIAVAGWWWSDRWRRSGLGEERRPLLADAIAQALDESLDDLRAERDARRAVIAAYARLEAVLAQHGLPRRASEAPLEYLRRMLAALAVTADAARRLTALFERARFSQHEVGVEMKEEAIAALETVRDDLRAARAEADDEGLVVMAGGEAGR